MIGLALLGASALAAPPDLRALELGWGLGPARVVDGETWWDLHQEPVMQLVVWNGEKDSRQDGRGFAVVDVSGWFAMARSLAREARGVDSATIRYWGPGMIIPRIDLGFVVDLGPGQLGLGGHLDAGLAQVVGTEDVEPPGLPGHVDLGPTVHYAVATGALDLEVGLVPVAVTTTELGDGPDGLATKAELRAMLQLSDGLSLWGELYGRGCRFETADGGPGRAGAAGLRAGLAIHSGRLGHNDRL